MYHECYDPQLVIPSTFEECLTYEMQILYLKKYIDDIASGGIPEADLSEIKAQIADLESRMDTVEGEINALNPEKVQEQLDAFSQELTAMNETLNGFKTQLTGLNETVSAHTESIATLTETQTTQGESIESLESDYGSLAAKVDKQATQILNKQDKLTFDSTPTEGSNNPVTSDGIKKAIEAGGGGGGGVILDDSVTQESQNGVKSSGIYSFVHEITDPLATKVGEHTSSIETLTETQTAQGETITQHGNQLTTNTEAIESLESDYGSLVEKVNNQETQIQNKQDKLTFDSTPTAGSNNPVTSDGIKKAIDAGGGGGGGTGCSIWKFSPTTEGGTSNIQFLVNVNILERNETTFTNRQGTLQFMNCTIVVPVPTDASVGDLYLGTMMVALFGSGISLPWPSDQPFVVAIRIVDLEQHIASVLIPPTGSPYRESGPVDYISVMYANATANVKFTV